MYTFLAVCFALLLGAGGVLYWQSRQKKQPKVEPTPPTPPTKVKPVELPVESTSKPVEPPVELTPKPVEPPVEPTPPPKVEPPKAGPKEPVGGKLPPRNPDPDALSNFSAARRLKGKVIDFKKFGLTPRTIPQDQRTSIPRNPYVLFQFEGDPNFTAGIAGTSRFYTSVLYLCDSTGYVYDFCISAPGAPRDEMQIAYKKLDKNGEPTIPGGAWIVQAADGQESGAQYRFR